MEQKNNLTLGSLFDGISYMNQAIRQWNEIFQIVKENCTTEYSGANPQDDLMERLLRARKG